MHDFKVRYTHTPVCNVLTWSAVLNEQVISMTCQENYFETLEILLLFIKMHKPVNHVDY